MPLAGFKPAIPASEQPQTHALDCVATRIGLLAFSRHKIQFETQFYIATVLIA